MHNRILHVSEENQLFAEMYEEIANAVQLFEWRPKGCLLAAIEIDLLPNTCGHWSLAPPQAWDRNVDPLCFNGVQVSTYNCIMKI